MSVFKTKCFFFLRTPGGNVEDLDRMQAAGFDGVFCNIGDHPPEAWEEVVRPRALQRGMFCGPWARTATRENQFSHEIVEKIVACAERWGSPFIVNAESELQGTGESETTWLAKRLAGYDWALSMEAWPFDNVAWWPLADVPMLPQISSAYGWSVPPVETWWAYGIKCCFATYGTFDGSKPYDYFLNAPYSLYTGDDCANDYAAWSPVARSFVGCKDTTPPPDGGDDLATVIGNSDGIAASFNRLRDLDPAGTLLVKDAKGKWPPLSTLTQPVDQWKAYDKAQRSLQILVDDHDEALGFSRSGDDDGG